MRIRSFALCAGLLALCALPAQAQTAAERLAMGERAPTAAERARRDADCALNVTEGDVTPTEIAGRPAGIATLPGFELLGLIAVQSQSDGTAAVVRMADLPRGGIAAVDFCGAASLAPHGEPLPVPFAAATRLMALVLRRGLDLEADYPAAARAIADQRQVFAIPAGRFAVVAGEAELTDADLAVFAADPRLDPSAPALRMGNYTFLRLRD